MKTILFSFQISIFQYDLTSSTHFDHKGNAHEAPIRYNLCRHCGDCHLCVRVRAPGARSRKRAAEETNAAAAPSSGPETPVCHPEACCRENANEWRSHQP